VTYVGNPARQRETRRGTARDRNGVPAQRVVIVGGGFAGLWATRALRHAPAELTLIDSTNHHVFQPLLYQMATGILSAGDIAPPIRDILRHQRNVSVLLGEVVGIDVDRRVVTFESQGSRTDVPYDSLIAATGAEQSYFGHDEFAEDAPGLKSVDDALEIRGRIFGAFEKAELEQDPEARAEWLTFVVIGAGPTGVEMAGQIAELAHRSLGGAFRSIDPGAARVVLLEAGPKLLAEFPDSLQRKAIKGLEALGVEIHLDTAVTGVDARTVETNREMPHLLRIRSRTKVWAAGVRASSFGRLLADATGAKLDRAGHVHVQPDCTIPGHPEIFVVGDLMGFDHLPGVAEVAMQSGRHAGRTIARRLRGDHAVRAFKYRDLGTIATISRFRAVAAIGPIRLSGFIGWLAWLVIHLLFLTGFKNRVTTLLNWTIAFVGRGRPERTITERQTLGPALTAAPLRDGDSGAIEVRRDGDPDHHLP
jgi:NADH dehydrogenase